MSSKSARDQCDPCGMPMDRERSSERAVRYFPATPINAMEIGDYGYAVHWALRVDDEGRCWLKPTYNISRPAGGTALMLVERLDDGFHVYPLATDSRYETGFNAASADHDYLPVHHVHGRPLPPHRDVVREGTRVNGFHVQSAEAPGESSSVVPNATMLPVQSLNGGDRDARSHSAAFSRMSGLAGVERHLSRDFQRRSWEREWPVTEMTRAVADALDKDPHDASWEKVRERLVSTAPAGTLDGGVPAQLPAPGAGYWLLSAIRAVLIVALVLLGGIGVLYLSDVAMQAALDHLLEKVPFARGASAGILRGEVVELATGWGIPESALPYTAMAPVWAMAVPKPKRPVPPPAVPDADWKALISAVRVSRDGAPAVKSSSPAIRTGSDVPAKFPHEFYNKPTLFRVTGIEQLHNKYGGVIDVPVVDFIVYGPATGTFEERRSVALLSGRLSKQLAGMHSNGVSLVAGYPVTKPTSHGRDVLYLAPLHDTDQDIVRLHQAATDQFGWWATPEEAAAATLAGSAKDAATDPQRKIADAKAALADLDKQWLDFTTATNPYGLRAYYFEMPALWRRPAAPAVTAYETALFELRELLDALPGKPPAEDADRAALAAERALITWSEAQQYAISIGVDDGRSVEEKTAARRLPELLNQFLDPTITPAQATRLRTLIEVQMNKLTTLPAVEHLEAVNADAQRLHRAPVLAAIER